MSPLELTADRCSLQTGIKLCGDNVGDEILKFIAVLWPEMLKVLIVGQFTDTMLFQSPQTN